MHDGHRAVQFFGQGVGQLMGGVVPSRGFQKQTKDVTTVFRRFLYVTAVRCKTVTRDVIKRNGVDGQLQFPGVVLSGAGDKGLGKEETTDPKPTGRACLAPVLQHVQTLH